MRKKGVIGDQQLGKGQGEFYLCFFCGLSQNQRENSVWRALRSGFPRYTVASCNPSRNLNLKFAHLSFAHLILQYINTFP